MASSELLHQPLQRSGKKKRILKNYSLQQDGLMYSSGASLEISASFQSFRSTFEDRAERPAIRCQTPILTVMEGKALLFKYLEGVDAVPLCLGTKDPEELIRTVKLLEPSFGGINLEDITQPKCFHILESLRRDMTLPIWHDDQQGLARLSLPDYSMP